MLYRIKKQGSDFKEIEPVGFKGFKDFGKEEKALEDLLAENLLTTLFEDGSLMPIFQERKWQPEADIYALNSEGDLIIFDLKRSSANEDALQQVLQYAQKAGKWNYAKLAGKYKTYESRDNSLKEAHQEAFDLETPLLEREFNNKQQLYVVGNAANSELIDAVDYWKDMGVSIDFLPYRLYSLGEEIYFEFFSKPYDRHVNPKNAKGILFDTNKAWKKNAIWEMFENEYVAAYGGAKKVVNRIKEGDYVFLSHKGCGIVGACKVKKGNVIKDDETWYRNVDFLTPKQDRNEKLKALPFDKAKELLDKNFYWAKTIKVPYLSNKESEILKEELVNKIGGNT